MGDKIDAPGEVPPKVLKVIVNEGSYATDPLEVEYFGGILASARTEGGRDDRSARLAKIVDSLSTYQLRTHFLIYSTVRHLYAGRNIPFNMEGRPKMQMFIPMDDYFAGMAFDANEAKKINALLNHVFFGLHAESLIEGEWQYGMAEHLTKKWPKIKDAGIVCQPSAPGAELFLAAHGRADQHLDFIFSPELKCETADLPKFFPNAIAIQA